MLMASEFGRHALVNLGQQAFSVLLLDAYSLCLFPPLLSLFRADRHARVMNLALLVGANVERAAYGLPFRHDRRHSRRTFAFLRFAVIVPVKHAGLRLE